MLAVLILLFGHISAANATSNNFKKTDKTLKFSVLDLNDGENSFLEEEEEEEEEDFHSHFYDIYLENSDGIIFPSEKNHENGVYNHLNNENNTSLPLWLEIRHILI
jgi:hypothetical protein